MIGCNVVDGLVLQDETTKSIQSSKISNKIMLCYPTFKSPLYGMNGIFFDEQDIFDIGNEVWCRERALDRSPCETQPSYSIEFDVSMGTLQGNPCSLIPSVIAEPC